MLLSTIYELLEMNTVWKFPMGESFYLIIKIEKASGELIGRGAISDGSRTFTAAARSANDYEGGFAIFQFHRDARSKWTSH